jgi:excisionase family DNA binding protein
MSQPPFRMVPNSFAEALSAGDLNLRQFALGVFLLMSSDYRTRVSRLTLEQIAAGIRSRPNQTLRDDLRVLRTTWIDYPRTQGERGPYEIRLTGLYVEPRGKAEPHGDFTKNDTASREVTSRMHEVAEPANPYLKRDPAPSEPHGLEVAPRSTSTSNEGSEVKPSSEESYDHLVGKTTVANGPPPFTSDDEPHEFPAGFTPRRVASPTATGARASHRPSTTVRRRRRRPLARQRRAVSDRLLTARELADVLGLKPGTILDHWEAGKLPGYKFGRAVRFDLDEVLAAARRRPGAGGEAPATPSERPTDGVVSLTPATPIHGGEDA